MKIFFLSNNPISKPLMDWLEEENKVLLIDQRLTTESVEKEKPDWIISYNYRYLITPDVIALMPEKILNLHISYLPWNRGVHPNLWSFIENTPKGVTIHQIDEGMDTGAIIAQKKVNLDSTKETVKSSYEKLHKEIQTLFKQIWKTKMHPSPQKGKGTVHTKKDSKILEEILLEKGYGISLETFLEEFKNANRKC